MTTVLNGLLGRLAAGLVAAGAARLVADGALVRGGVASGWTGVGIGAIYGCVAGGAFVALELSVFDVLGVPPAMWDALGMAVGWSVALFAVAALGRAARERTLDRPFVAELAAYHLVYGLCLGVWIRVTWIT